jgi:hypothetical protein
MKKESFTDNNLLATAAVYINHSIWQLSGYVLQGCVCNEIA